MVILLQGTFLSFFGNLRIICDFVAHGDHSSNIDARGNSTEHCLDSFDLWLFLFALVTFYGVGRKILCVGEVWKFFVE